MKNRRQLAKLFYFGFIGLIYILILERCSEAETNSKKDLSAIKIDNIISCTSNGLTVADSTTYMKGGGSDFKPTLSDSAQYKSTTPAGMVWIPGGEFSMGGVNPVGIMDGGKEAMNDARPVHRVSINGF